jgi:CheY-like chemotaxis protein
VKILLIDDDSPLSERLVGVLSELTDVQVEVHKPSNLDVDQTITRLHPDVVLINIDQLRGRGPKIIRQIHGRRKERVPIIVAIASSASIQYRASCHQAGATYFFDSVREQEWLLDSLAQIREQLG